MADDEPGSVINLNPLTPFLSEPGSGGFTEDENAQNAHVIVEVSAGAGSGFGARMLYPYNRRTRRPRFVR